MNQLSFDDTKALQLMSKRYRSMVLLNSVLLLGLIGACVSNASVGDAPLRRGEIRATAFVLVNEEGQELGRFACHEEGASLAMWNESEDTAVQLGVGLEASVEFGWSCQSISHGPLAESPRKTADDAVKHPIGSLVMISSNTEGADSITNIITTAEDNRWVASRVGSGGDGATALMMNQQQGTVITLEAGGERDSVIATTLFAGADSASVSVTNDDLDAGLYYYDEAAGLRLSRFETEGPHMDLKLTERAATLTVKDELGAELARVPE